MNTLDQVAYNLSHTTSPTCVFVELGRCSSDREFGIICGSHANQILGIKLVEERAVSAVTGEEKLYKMAATQARSVFLPFPYTFYYTDGTRREIDKTRKPCIDTDALKIQTAEFVSKLHMQSSDWQRRTAVALMSMFVDGSLCFTEMPKASFNFQTFCSSGIRSYLEKRWENCSVYVQRTVDGTVLYESFPMANMPLFYQIILSYIPLSSNQGANRSIGDSQTYYEVLQPRIILNEDNHEFQFINCKEPHPLYLHHGNATTSTPLVLAGYQKHRHAIELFKQTPMFYSDIQLDNLPGLCRGNA